MIKMTQQVLYISSACSKKVFKKNEEIKKKQTFIYGMPVAANKFHGLIMKGLNLNGCKVTALTGLPISNKTHSKIVWKKFEDEENNINFKYLGFINLPILKQLLIGLFMFFNILKWNKKTNTKNKLIIFDASYVSVIPFIILANKFINCKTIAIFADIYDYMAPVSTQNIKDNSFKSIIRKTMTKCYNAVSGFVFLSEPMNELINKNNKPYMIMEGIVDSSVKTLNKDIKKTKFVVMYAGALREEYGLKILIDGYMKYNNANSELWIYGDGDYSSEIINKSKIDNRIKFFGKVDNAVILDNEKKASLLINPRPTKLEFTRYSFPSKIMEYMSSGTPVLTTKLPTIPNEYKDYLYFINKETSTGITNSLNKISSINNDELIAFGINSQKFIMANKTEKMQTKKIIELCGEIDEKNKTK